MMDKINTGRADQVATGIPGVDDILEGGLVRGSIITVSGDTGTGKTTFGIQFLQHGAKNCEEPGLYISFDEHKRVLYRNMTRYGWDLEKLERDQKLLFIEYPPHEIGQFTAQEATIRDLIDTIGVERLVIDSVTNLELVHENDLERRNGMIRLIQKLRNWGCTTILMSDNYGEGKNRWGAEVFSDGLIQLYNIKRGSIRQRALEVVKMRGVNHLCHEVPFRITENGITLNPIKPLENRMEEKHV